MLICYPFRLLFDYYCNCCCSLLTHFIVQFWKKERHTAQIHVQFHIEYGGKSYLTQTNIKWAVFFLSCLFYLQNTAQIAISRIQFWYIFRTKSVNLSIHTWKYMKERKKRDNDLVRRKMQINKIGNEIISNSDIISKFKFNSKYECIAVVCGFFMNTHTQHNIMTWTNEIDCIRGQIQCNRCV